MTVTDVVKDAETLTLTATAEFAVTADRAWQLVADPRQLERWWGPPTYPATVVDHDLVAGGIVSYYMTGPQGDQPHGRWEVLEVEEPRRVLVEHVFTDADGAVEPEMPRSRMLFEIADRDGGVTFTVTTLYPSLETMERMVAMGQAEGLRQAMGQIDALLTEPSAS